MLLGMERERKTVMTVRQMAVIVATARLTGETPLQYMVRRQRDLRLPFQAQLYQRPLRIGGGS